MQKLEAPSKLVQAIDAALARRLGGERSLLDGPKVMLLNIPLILTPEPTHQPPNTTTGEG